MSVAKTLMQALLAGMVLGGGAAYAQSQEVAPAPPAAAVEAGGDSAAEATGAGATGMTDWGSEDDGYVPEEVMGGTGPTALEWEVHVRAYSDIRSRGVSDSMRDPGVSAALEFTHESGVVGKLELASVSRKQFPGGMDTRIIAGAVWRGGDHDGLRYGVGMGGEYFPGAKALAPQRFDFATGQPTDWGKTKFNTTFAVFELGYQNLDFSLLYAISKNYRGIDTGTVCGSLLQWNPDPTSGLGCYAKGKKNSRGSVLLDLDYKIPLNEDKTTVRLHVGYQYVRNFSMANFVDYGIGVDHEWLGLVWKADMLYAKTRRAELFTYMDGARPVRVDNAKLVFSVGKAF